MGTKLIYTDTPEQAMQNAWDASSEAKRLLTVGDSTSALDRYNQAVVFWRDATWMRRGSSARWIAEVRDDYTDEFPWNYERGIIELLQGLIRSDQQRYPEAESLIREALRLHEQRFSEEDYLIPMLTRHMLGDVLVAQGRLAEGEELLNIVATFYKEYCDNYTNYLNAILNGSLGNLYGRQGRIPEADKAFLGALAIQQSWAYPGWPAMDMAGTLLDYAARQRDWGRTFKAEDLVEQAEELCVAYRQLVEKYANEPDELADE